MSLRDLFEEHLSDVKESGDDHIRATCPCPRRKKRAFYAHSESGYWNCFSCGQHGSLRSFLEIVTNNASDLYDQVKHMLAPKEGAAKKTRSAPKRPPGILPDYILGAWDTCPLSLVNAGFHEDILRDHDVGFDKHRERITFPIRNRTGELVGVAGRTIHKDVEPRYLVYGDAKEFAHFDETYRPDTRRYLYGFQSIWPKRYYERDKDNFPPIILVEGYKGTLWLRQNGFPSTCGLMGSSLSPGQAADITTVRGPYYVFLDYEPGKQKLTWEPLSPERTIRTRFSKQYHDLSCAALRIARKLQRHGETRIVRYPPGCPERTSPDDLTKESLDWAIANAETPATFFTRERDALAEQGVTAPTSPAHLGAKPTPPSATPPTTTTQG